MTVAKYLPAIAIIFIISACNVTRKKNYLKPQETINIDPYLARMQPSFAKDSLNGYFEITSGDTLIKFTRPSKPSGNFSYQEFIGKTGKTFRIDGSKKEGIVTKEFKVGNPLVRQKQFSADGRLLTVEYWHSEEDINDSPPKQEFPVGLKHEYNGAGIEIKVIDYDHLIHFKIADIRCFLQKRNTSPKQGSAICTVYSEKEIFWELWYKTLDGKLCVTKIDALTGKIISDNVDIQLIDD